MLQNIKLEESIPAENERLEAEYLEKCQVDTPPEFVEELWKLVTAKRQEICSVVDYGAGDGRFASAGTYESYEGYEIDERRSVGVTLPPNAVLKNECAFTSKKRNFDLCIGNPPFVRHHDIDKKWYKDIARLLNNELKVRIDGRSNAFLLFLCLAIAATKEDGLIALLIPFEWVSRPSAEPIRDLIRKNGWNVDVYRFTEDIFDNVMTTASFSIIDQSKREGKWQYHTIDKTFKTETRPFATGSDDVFQYAKRGTGPFAQRGLSPGGQKIFCLSEQERIDHRLEIGRDVVPCVTSLKHVDPGMTSLTELRFKKLFLESGKRCWLIKTWCALSDELRSYVDQVPTELRSNYTCNNRDLWWKLVPHGIPSLLYSSGFVGKGPKILRNGVGAMAVGTVQGIHQIPKSEVAQLLKTLTKVDFAARVVAHSGRLRKVEVGQMNEVLNQSTRTT